MMSSLAYDLLDSYIKGKTAYYLGKTINDNPYFEFSSLWKAWNNGFEDACWNVGGN